MEEITGKRVVVMGLGRFGGGVGAARYCATHGAADVLVTDTADAGELRRSVAALDGLDVRFRLGEHVDADFAAADLIVVNPAVDMQRNRYLHAAERAAARITTEVKLVIDRLPNRMRTIGVTGTAGKSTTVSMIGHILADAHGPQRVHVGGNIGGSLLDRLDAITADDWVVLELSSFMLQMLGEWSPHIAVVTSLGDNHLDRHGSIDAYVRAKKNLLRWQKREDRCVLGPTVADWRFDTSAVSVIEDTPLDIALAIPGRHNQLNAAMAAAAAECAGIDRGRAMAALRRFRGLPHRLQFIAERGDVRYYNDSKSTTPESAMLALEAFDPGTVHVILGGSDKGADLRPLARAAARRAAAVYTIGHTGHDIAEAVAQQSGHCPVRRCGILPVAVREAAEHARPGEVVLLSPGCASYDQFEHYEHRGDSFAQCLLRPESPACEDTPAPA